MTQIASEDYAARRIYLHPDTLLDGIQPIQIYREHRERRRLNSNGERDYAPMVTASGNDEIGDSLYTPRRAELRTGVRWVPHDTGSGTQYTVQLLNQVVNKVDRLADNFCFDRSTVDANVDIDPSYPPVEIREVNVAGGALSNAQDTILRDILRVLLADERVRDGSYQRLDRDTLQVLVNKQVTRNGDDIDLVEVS